MSKKWTNVIQPYLWTAIPGIFFCFAFPKLYGNSLDGLSPILQIPMMLSVGRIHNTPAWFIPMIILFFLSSWVLLKLETKGWLYKILPFLFLITIFLPRQDVDYNSVLELTYFDKYLAYLNYVFVGFIHFFSMYVFGMFFSANKNIIDKLWNLRFLFIFLMITTACLNVYSSLNLDYSNGTISKIFLTIVALVYLKHYDNWLLEHSKINNVLDLIAKYSFGIFFIHWYIFFLYNLIFNLPNVIQNYPNILSAIFIVITRFLVVTILSIFTLKLSKQTILKLNPETNTRKFLGV